MTHDCDCIKCECKEQLHDEVAYCENCNEFHMKPNYYCECDKPNLGEDLPFDQRPLMPMFCGTCGGKLKDII